MLLLTLVSALLLSGGEAQAPGDAGNSACPQSYPDTWRVLMDSWRYRDLLDNNNAAWEERSVDGDSFTWTPGIGGLCMRDVRSCDYTVGTQNNWAFTQHISKDIPAGQPSNFPVKVYVNITYAPVGCVTAQGCVQRFDVYNYLVNTPQTRAIQRDTSRYSLLQGIQTSGNQDATVILDFDLSQNQNGFYLAFRDPNTCVSVERVIVYRNRCPGRQTGLVVYDEKPAPSVQTRSFQASCVPNAMRRPTSSLTVTCTSEGEWVGSPQCQCNGGYRSTGSACVACPAGKYSTHPPSTSCSSCPANTVTTEEAVSVCSCLDGFYRADGETASDGCTPPPSAVVITSIETTDTTATLKWRRPEVTGRHDFFYMILRSDPNRGGFITYRNMLVDPNPEVTFTVTGLQPATMYTFKIVTANGVSDMDPDGAKLRVTESDSVTTKEGLPGPPVGVLGFCSVVVWQKPDQPNGDITGFDVLFVRESEQDTTGEPLSIPKTILYQRVDASVIPAGRGDVLFQVRAKTSAGAGSWSALQDISCNTLGKIEDVTVFDDVVVWDRPSSTGGEITGYELRFYLNGGADTTPVLEVNDPSRHWFYPSLPQIPQSEVPVYYQVRAVNSAGKGAWSDETIFCDLEPCLPASRHIDPDQPCPNEIPPCNFDTCRNLGHKFCAVDKNGCGGSCQVSSCRVCTAGEEFTTDGCDRSQCDGEYDKQCITNWGKCIKSANREMFVRPMTAESSMNCVPHSCLGTSTGTTPTTATTATTATAPEPTSSSSCPSDIPPCDYDTCRNLPHQICVIDETGCGGLCQVSSCRVCTAGEEYTADGCESSQCDDEYDTTCIRSWGTCVKRANRHNFDRPTTSATNCVPHPCL